jgi:Alanine-zipper, major outer membrane lipoprotein
MAIRGTKKSAEALEILFETGKKPTQQDFFDFIASFYHKDEDISFLISLAASTLTDAQVGSNNSRYMTALRVYQAIVWHVRLAKLPLLNLDIADVVNQRITDTLNALMATNDGDNVINTLGELFQAFQNFTEEIGGINLLRNRIVGLENLLHQVPNNLRQVQNTFDSLQTQVTTAQNAANSAQTKANEAWDKGVDAYNRANAAQSTADTATTKANTAQTKANEAWDKGVDAWNRANTAQDGANNAWNKGVQAKTVADAAAQDASNALGQLGALTGVTLPGILNRLHNLDGL